MKQLYYYRGPQQDIVTKLKQLRHQWGAPGDNWRFTGNYRQITIEVRDPKMKVWLILSGFQDNCS